MNAAPGFHIWELQRTGKETDTMDEIQNYDEAVRAIKTAILQSHYEAAKSVKEKQLMLYYSIRKYISLN